MGKKSKVAITIIVVLAILLVVTGIVGAALTFPGPAEQRYPFAQKETVPADSFDSVKIDGRTFNLDISTAAVDEASISVNGKLFRVEQADGDLIQMKVRNGELRISLANVMLMTNMQVFGIEIMGESADDLQAQLVLPQKQYRAVKVQTVTGNILVRGVESSLLDVESEMGNVVFETAQAREAFSLKAESDHGAVTIFGEPIRTKDKWYDDEWYDDEYRNHYFGGNGDNWVELESEHGSIDVKSI